jgi:ABC-type branched-subunit amino acid transport system ATPase component/ABC-type branched-subunit amino acid transport system permease subunit
MESGLILGAWVTRQILFWTLVQGLIFGLLAMGIVLIYRSTRVINFAVGNMGLPGATLFGLMIINYNWPFWPALIAALVIGGLLGLVTEVIVVKRLFHRPRIVLLIATVAIADFWRAIVLLGFPDIEGAQTTYPAAIGRGYDNVLGDFSALEGIGVGADDGILIKGSDIQILVLVPLVAILLGVLMSRTTFGKAITASADNPDLSRLSGVNPHMVSTVVWTIGGLLATLSMILLSSGRAATGIDNLGPFTLTNALAAAVIAGMRSFPRAMFGGILIALGDNIFGFNFTRDPGLSTLLVFVAVIIALYWQSRTENDESPLSFATKVRPLPPHIHRIWWIRWMPRIILGTMLVAVWMFSIHHATVFDWADSYIWFWDTPPERIVPSKWFLYSTVIAFAIITASLTVITGWSGQVSLAQASYAGIGALSAAAFNRGIELDIGYGSTRLLDVQWAGIPTLPSIVCAVILTAIIAAITGIGALRVRGIMLAISTFSFAIAAEKYIYQRPFFSDGDSSVVFERGHFLGIHLKQQENFFRFSLVCLVITILVIARVRRSGIGRSIIAVRDNSDTASAYTVSPVRMKLTAFAIAGGIAGLGGALFGNAARQIRFGEAHFQIADSIQAVNMVVMGGLGSIIGPVLGAFWVRGLPSLFRDNAIIGLVTSSVGFLVMLMYFPGGFVQIAYRAREAIVSRVELRHAADAASSTTATPNAVRRGNAGGDRAGVVPLYEWILSGVAILMKVVVLGYVLRLALDHLTGDGTRTIRGFPIESTWFDFYLVAALISGLISLAMLVRLAQTTSDAIGSKGTKTGYSLYLIFEPVIPFLWPAVIGKWLRKDLASAEPREARVYENLPIGATGQELTLQTSNITVRFGGNVAVSDISIDVGRDEIVGLIGTNGAGKSTLMNAVGGYVPAEGKVRLLGKNIESLASPTRSAMGLGRTFQAATLFPELTVRECVQVALEARHRSSFARSALFLDMANERRMKSDADDLIDFLGLGRYADSFISDLSTGTRRIVELSGLLALDADVLCLDEPTAGVAQRETEAFGPLIVEIRKEMGASMLIIEHDMPLIMSISDRVYCLEAGSVIAEGQPEEVRANPLVIASYLGTDERAIDRSDS